MGRGFGYRTGGALTLTPYLGTITLLKMPYGSSREIVLPFNRKIGKEKL
jgi:hypothetical protein